MLVLLNALFEIFYNTGLLSLLLAEVHSLIIQLHLLLLNPFFVLFGVSDLLVVLLYCLDLLRNLLFTVQKLILKLLIPIFQTITFLGLLLLLLL